MAKYIALLAGKLKEVAGLTTSAGAGDAGKIPALDGNGRLDNSMMPAGFGAETQTITASENLAAGDFVNIHNSTGLKARKADASGGPSKKAHGFVLAAVTSGQPATVYYGNINNQVAGLTVGDEYYLSHSTPGGVVNAAGLPTTAGHIVQRLGVATVATEILVELANEVELS
jgi:hypothetical protein